METDAKVLEALALLRQAGRLDLLKDGALAPARPARRASAGVAAAVAACSPPRVAPAGKVRGAASGVGTKGGSGAGGRRFYGRERGGESPKVSRGTGRAGQRTGWNPARKWRAGVQVSEERQAGLEKRVGALEQSAKKNLKGRKAGTRQGRPGAYRQERSQAGGGGAPVVYTGAADASSVKARKAGFPVGRIFDEFHVKIVTFGYINVRLILFYRPKEFALLGSDTDYVIYALL
ncbi:hypothetical protein NDU88_000698 [Pleurodeles waltl]|uniref:Uncharacterized protein n=1 Tax=Pleurodeles waltl TaxID=8319 RepID=A0AAV7TGM2_PLEWA|nr:hypothetical protein NDU88_000698 [Pleurodeles waltl]